MRKKMKRVMVIIGVLFFGMSATARNRLSIGFDAGGALKDGQWKVLTGFGFHEHWSVRYSTVIGTEAWRRGTDEEYETHRSEFVIQEHKPACTSDTCISVLYWPRTVYKGLFTGLGGRNDREGKTGCIISLGYCIPVWKGLSAAVSYSTCITDTINDKSYKEGLTFEICWIIGGR